MKATASQAPYKLCKVYVGPREAFAYFHYFNEITKKYVREKIRLNVSVRGLSDEEKRRQLEFTAEKFNQIIKQRNAKGLYHSQFVKSISTQNAELTIVDALEFVKESDDEKLSDDRRKCMRETAGIFEQFYKINKAFENLKIAALNDDFLELFIKWCKENKKAGKTINKYLGTLQFATEWLCRKKIIEKSFSTRPLRVAAPKNETGRFPPLTHEEKLRAFAFFKEKNKGYHLFLFWLYYTCIRGAELHRIKRGDINFEKRTIFLKWFNTKNGLSNYVQIFEPLHNLLLEYGVDKLPADSYIFGARFEPSKTKYVGDASSEMWLYYRAAMEMPKDKQAYGMKHTFNVDYIENNKYNVDWEWLRRHNRHATVQQTQQYISGLTAYFLDETKAIILDYQ